jgi:hypothetical protein
MRFNSKSITLNKGFNLRLKVNVPEKFPIDEIAYDVLEFSVKDFNNILDNRKNVREIIDNIEVDILRLGLTAETFYLWIFVKEEDVNKIERGSINVTFSGKLVYNSDNDISPERVIIEDVIYRMSDRDEWKSIIGSSVKKELTSV